MSLTGVDARARFRGGSCISVDCESGPTCVAYAESGTA